MAKRKDKKKRKHHGDDFFIIEGHVLNEKTGKLEPYRKKVYWNRGRHRASHSPITWG